MQLKLKCLNEPIPVFSWIAEDTEDTMQLAYRINVFTEDNTLVWDSGEVKSDNSACVRYDGNVLEENKKYLWKVFVTTENAVYESEISEFITGLYDFDSIIWISPLKTINAPVIHREFTLESVHDYATLNVCGLGYFEVYINGKKVSEDLMSPVRTDYDDVEYSGLKYPFEGETRKSIKYLNYEVSSYLKEGKNTISVWLAKGWYIQEDRIVEGLFNYGDELKAFFILTNGKDVVKSDLECYCTNSPILYDNIFYGEKYDFTSDIRRYSVHLAKAPTGVLMPQLCPPERSREVIIPTAKGNIYDAGKCMTGFAEITFRGNYGDEVRISYSEDIDENGELDYTSTVGYEESDKDQIQADVVILDGEVNTYVPRFVWHTFRYFKIEAPKGVAVEDVKVHYVCTDAEQRAFFESSSEMLNKIHAMSLNTQLTNTHGCMPMDCPHRERLGYTGDGQLSSLSVLTNFDAHQMYVKWVTDIFDAQSLETGFVPHTAPFCGGAGGHGWGSAVAVVPWNIYLQYGDTQILEKAEPHIEKWLEYLNTRREDGFVTHEQPGSWCLGDWCMPSKYPWSEPHLEDIKIPSILVNTVYFIHCCDIYLNICSIVGKEPKEWIAKERSISVDAVNTLLMDGNYADGEQGSNMFPLYVGIVPKEHEQTVLENTIKRAENNNYRFETGISGTKFTFHVLDKYNRNDIALKMMLCTEYPSFGNMIKNGATSLWETWEGNGSKNHTAFSSADSWISYGLAGVKPQGGYKEFTLKPYFAPELDFMNYSINTEYGVIGICWTRNEDAIEVEIKVPFNTTAHVDLNGKCFDLKAGTYKEVI